MRKIKKRRFAELATSRTAGLFMPWLRRVGKRSDFLDRGRQIFCALGLFARGGRRCREAFRASSATAAIWRAPAAEEATFERIISARSWIARLASLNAAISEATLSKAANSA